MTLGIIGAVSSFEPQHFFLNSDGVYICMFMNMYEGKIGEAEVHEDSCHETN